MSQDFREAWLAALGERAGLTSLQFDEAGVCQLMLDETLILTIHKPENPEKLVLFGQIHTPPLPIETAKLMLKRNRTHAKLAAPVISLSPEEDAIEVHLVLDRNELESGDAPLERLIEELEYWRGAFVNDQAVEPVESVPYDLRFIRG